MNKKSARVIFLLLIALAIGNAYLSLAPTAWSEARAQAFDGDLFESMKNPGHYVCICGGDNCTPCLNLPQ